jgi:hypothetical protein
MTWKPIHTALTVLTIALLALVGLIAELTSDLSAFGALFQRRISFFHEGGAGMYPTAFAGFLLLASACLLAFRPERRFVPLVVSLGLFTLCTGVFATSVGLLHCFHYVAKAPTQQMTEAWPLGPAGAVIEGIAQASHCVVLALSCIVGALAATSVAAWRASRIQRTAQLRGDRDADADLRAAG